MLSRSRIRLGVLIGLLTTLWAYAIITDHPAPAWGTSQLHDLFFTTVVLLIVAALVAGLIRAWSSRRE